MPFIINAVVLFLIVLVVWFFFMKKDGKTMKVDKKIQIIVDGGYQPSSLELPVGQKSILEFVRKDPSSCLEEVVFPAFNIRQYLPLDTPTAVVITPDKKGTFKFHCGMSMFFGKVHVV